jgi:nucleotide-binding universal stress UspA family protein
MSPKILHPTDFSECAKGAEAAAVDLGTKLGDELVLCHVLVETPLYGEGFLTAPKIKDVYDAQRKWAEAKLEARCADLRQRGIKASWRVATGPPFQMIVDMAAREHAALIVMGTRGRSGLDRILLGSVAERVIRLAPCPVLTVRQLER